MLTKANKTISNFWQ